MPKAILELEMPENCKKCALSTITCDCVPLSYRYLREQGRYAKIPNKGRRPDCPLKLVEGNEG